MQQQSHLARAPIAVGDRVEVKLPRYLAQQYRISARVLEGEVTEVHPRSFSLKGAASVRTPDYCGVCGLSIDSPASRKLRIGKICAEKNGVDDLWRELNAQHDADPALLQQLWDRISRNTSGEWSLPRGNVPVLVLAPSGNKPVAYADGSRRIDLSGQDVLTFAWDFRDTDFAAIKDAVKSLGARWNPLAKQWSLQLTVKNAQAVEKLAADHGFEPTEIAESVLDSWASAARDFPAPEVESIKQPSNPRQITLAGKLYRVSWPWGIPEFNVIKETVKAIQGRKWDGVNKTWTVPQGSEGALLTLIEGFGFEASDEAREQIESAAEAAIRRHAASSASSVQLALNIPDSLVLYPFQRAGVAYAADVYAAGGHGTFIADDMGLGKTRQSIAVAEHLDLYPHLVVTTASAKGGWRREHGKVVPGRTVWVARSKKDVPPAGVDVYVVNYDVLANGWLPLEKGQKSRDRVAKLSPLAEALLAIGPKLVSFDEIHKAKASSFSAGARSQRSSACETIGHGASVKFTLGLTGTAVENRPSELVQPLSILGQLEAFGGKWGFASRYFASKDEYGRWDFNGAKNLGELNQKLRATCFIRRLKTDPKIGLELPAKTREVVDVELSGSGIYEQALAEFEHAPNDERLGALSHLLTAVALEKIPAAVDWVKDFLDDSDRKLIVFSKYIEVQKALFDLVEPLGAVHIFGSDSGQQRTWAEERFQSDPSVRVIVCSLKAASEALTLTAAADVLTVDLDWVPTRHDQAEDRAYRIGQNKPVTAYYLLADVDADQEQWDLLEQKRRVVGATVNGNADDAIVVKNAAAELLARLAAVEERKAA